MTEPMKDLQFVDRMVGGTPHVNNSSNEALMIGINILYRTLQRLDRKLDSLSELLTDADEDTLH